MVRKGVYVVVFSCFVMVLLLYLAIKYPIETPNIPTIYLLSFCLRDIFLDSFIWVSKLYIIRLSLFTFCSKLETNSLYWFSLNWYLPIMLSFIDRRDSEFFRSSLVAFSSSSTTLPFSIRFIAFLSWALGKQVIESLDVWEIPWYAVSSIINSVVICFFIFRFYVFDFVF